MSNLSSQNIFHTSGSIEINAQTKILIVTCLGGNEADEGIDQKQGRILGFNQLIIFIIELVKNDGIDVLCTST